MTNAPKKELKERKPSQKSASDRVQKLYTERASFYDSLFIDFLGWGRELEKFFRKSNYVQPSRKVLDAGCGTGIITKTLYQLAREKGAIGMTFHAFDLTESMLDIFRKWIKAQGAENIELKQADILEIETLPSHWKEYDLIVSSTMLEYLPKNKVKDALANLRQLTRNGGTLLVFITKRSLITRWLAGRWWETNTYEKSEIKAVFNKAGFERVEFKRFSSNSWWSRFILVIEAKK